MNGKFNYFMIIVSVSILSFLSTPGQCDSSNSDIRIPPITGEMFEMPKSFKSRGGEYISILKSPNGKYIAILKIVEGGVHRLIVEISPKKILDPGINDVHGIQWLPGGNSLIFTVSPIYGKPGIYTWNIKDNVIKKVLKPKYFDGAYPDGKDFFEMLSLSQDGDKLFFFYSPDVNKTDFRTFRSKENLYVINVDGTGLRKIIQDGKILSGFVFSKDIPSIKRGPLFDLFKEISIPERGHHNLFHDNHSIILFADGLRGVCTFNLKYNGLGRILGRDTFVYSVTSFGNNILLIYLTRWTTVWRLSIIKDEMEEEILYSLPAYRREFSYLAPDPSGKKVAFIESRYSKKGTELKDLSIINIIDRRKKYVAELDKAWPVFSWDSAGDRLYFFKTAEGKSGFYVWDENKWETRIIKEVRGLSIFYLYPRLINERYILFLGEDYKKTLILGKLDLKSWQMDMKEIGNEDYGMMMYLFTVPGNRLVYQVPHQGSETDGKKAYMWDIYMCDINLDSKLLLKDCSQYLSPIGYNKMLDRFIFFRNNREIVAINLDDPSKQEVLLSVPCKKRESAPIKDNH